MTDNEGLTTFWGFAVALYGVAEIKPLSLSLQDTRGDDILLVYACLFAALRGAGELGPERMRALVATLAPWQTEVTGPLRQVRRRVGEEAQALKAQILAAELAAERIAYDRAEPLLGPRGGPRADAAARAWNNFAAYRVVTGRAVSAEDTAPFARLLEAALALV